MQGTEIKGPTHTHTRARAHKAAKGFQDVLTIPDMLNYFFLLILFKFCT